MASSVLKMASLEQDILPALLDYLPRVGVSPEEVSKVVKSLSEANCEDVLEHYGVLVSEQPSAFDVGSENSGLHNMFEKELMK